MHTLRNSEVRIIRNVIRIPRNTCQDGEDKYPPSHPIHYEVIRHVQYYRYAYLEIVSMRMLNNLVVYLAGCMS